MRRVKIFLVFLIITFFSLPIVSSAHSGKAKHHFIIDTDGGTDDYRAICLALASQEFEILSITTSDGVLHPETTAIKVKALLETLGHGGIPVGTGKATLKKAPPFRKFAEQISWGCTTNLSLPNTTAVELMLKTIQNEDQPITLVCLGSLTNIASLFQLHPEIKTKIQQIIWYNESLQKPKGFNYECDKESAAQVIRSGCILKMISLQDQSHWSWKTFKESGIPYLLYDKLILSELKQFKDNKHLKDSPAWLIDELCLLYLADSTAFISEKDSVMAFSHIKPLKDKDFTPLINKILTDKSVVRNQVFTIFPSDSPHYQKDVEAIKEECMIKFGPEEWRACVLTNELHGHLGVYAIIGAKMGLFAREYFNIGKDEFRIVAHTGTIPPYSCMIDGLQVSTGSTTGHGLLTVSGEKAHYPSAEFTFKDQTIRLSLSPEYALMIASDIKQAVETHGLGNDLYWIKVRELALKYWSEWNRKEIFDIEKIN